VPGRGELYDLERDPAELDNRFDEPSLVKVRLALMGLPTGDQAPMLGSVP
jgi:hypothetical protein